MNRCLFALLTLCLAFRIARADEIHLTDGSIIRGMVVRVTDSDVRYRDRQAGEEDGMEPGPGEKTADTIRSVDRYLVKKIVYGNRETLTMEGAEKLDRIFLYDGRILEGKVVHIADRYLAYRPRGQGYVLVVSSAAVRKLLFSNNSERFMGGPSVQDASGKDAAGPRGKMDLVWPDKGTRKR